MRSDTYTFYRDIEASWFLCEAVKIIDGGRECWPQAEALIGFINAFQLSGDEKYLVAAQRVWDYANQHLIDCVCGEWLWRINEDGKPDATLPKISEWKGPYHVSKACLETMRRLSVRVGL